ncbi:MAG: hypothetical protein JNM90_16515 [Burkholderiales bacterium]|nr:hypothetical protein [Burkholderiales bacterium]
MIGRIAAVAALTCSVALPASACVARLDGARSIDAARHTLAFRTDPAKVTVGKPFAVEVAVCPKDPALAIDGLGVDAHMPAHRHGMNYRPGIKPLGAPGRFRADGLMFHMPGHWELLFDVRDARGSERIRAEVRL